MFKIQRAIDKKQPSLDLSEANLYLVPTDLKTLPDLGQITQINLSHNQLFNGKRERERWPWYIGSSFLLWNVMVVPLCMSSILQGIKFLKLLAASMTSSMYHKHLS